MIYLYTDEVSIIIKGYSAKAISNDKEWLEETIADTFDDNNYIIGRIHIKKIEEVNSKYVLG